MSLNYPDLPNSKFPNEIDNDINRKENPTTDDLVLVQQCYSLMASGDISGAYKIIEQNPQLKDAQLSAYDYNKLRDAVIAMERWYQTGIQEYLAENAKQIVFSENPPDNQMLGDVWMKIVAQASEASQMEVEMYHCTTTGRYEKVSIGTSVSIDEIDGGTY